MEVNIPKDSEYRIEVLENQKIRIMVTAGLAEVYGQELLNEKWYNFNNIRFSIFTFTGARLKVEGNCELQYLAASTSFRKIFEYFDSIKDTSKAVLVLGRGRSTFCSTLANYFVKIHKKLDFVELDPSKGNIFPGVLSFLHIEHIVDYSEKIKLNNPYCLFYGSLTIDNDELFELQTDKLSSELISKETKNFKTILCPELPNDLIDSLIKKFKISEIIVIGNERLFHKLNFTIPKIFIENSGFISENTVAKSINRYFNGSNGDYTPTSFMVKRDWTVYRVGEQFTAPESALPLGASRKIGKTDICKCDIVQDNVLGISEAEKEEDIPIAPVIGFVVCLDAEKFRILCPQPKLPKLKYLIQGNVKYIDY